jgi:hypothetical protein
MEMNATTAQNVSRMFKPLGIGAAVFVLGLFSPKSWANAVPSEVLFIETFDYPDGPIVDENMYWNQIPDPTGWEMTSGALFAASGAGYTGIPNVGNNSAVFRLTTKTNYLNVRVTFALLNLGLTTTENTPTQDWDGVHIFLRYQDEYELYYASINRRDNQVVIKKKIRGGPSNGGTYYDISSYETHAVPYDEWQMITATVENNPDGSVTINLYDGDALLVTATDHGVGGPPITSPGKVGIRGDNAILKFDNFIVTSVAAEKQTTPSPVHSIALTRENSTTLKATWNAPSEGNVQFFYPTWFSLSPTAAYSSVSLHNIRVVGGKIEATVSGVQGGGGNLFLYHATALNGPWSTPSNAGSIAAETGPPAPTGVVAVAGNSEVTITWNPVPGATSYNLYRTRFPPATKASGYKIENVTSPKVNTGFDNGMAYYMVVTSVNEFGESAESVEVSATPKASP